MCIFIASVPKAKTVVKGYKVAVKDKYNHYYSPSTGMRYKVGKINEIKGYGKYCCRRSVGFPDVLNNNDRCHIRDYLKKTAIFYQLGDAKMFKTELEGRSSSTIECIILEMKLSSDLFFGEYLGRNVYIGSEIKSIKKIKE